MTTSEYRWTGPHGTTDVLDRPKVVEALTLLTVRPLSLVAALDRGEAVEIAGHTFARLRDEVPA